ncbi:MAG TPA: hypothetical protein VF813_06200, partial [Anaerolineaceae bacterium]
VTWQNASWTADVPAGTSLAVSVRTGNTSVPDSTWSAFTPLASPGTAVNVTSRYIQYRADLTSPDGVAIPVLRDVSITLSTGP